jgi:hypothetical protein
LRQTRFKFNFKPKARRGKGGGGLPRDAGAFYKDNFEGDASRGDGFERSGDSAGRRKTNKIFLDGGFLPNAATNAVREK